MPYIKNTNRSKLVYTLSLILNISIFLLVSFGVFSTDVIMKDLALSKESSLLGLYFSSFNHLNFIHLFMNIYAFYVLHKIAKNYYSDKELFLLYFLSPIIINPILWVYYNSIYANETFVLVGYSGVLFLLVGAIFPALNKTSQILTICLNLGLWLIFFLFVSPVKISGETHLLGFIFGIIISRFKDFNNTIKIRKDDTIEEKIRDCIDSFLEEYRNNPTINHLKEYKEMESDFLKDVEPFFKDTEAFQKDDTKLLQAMDDFLYKAFFLIERSIMKKGFIDSIKKDFIIIFSKKYENEINNFLSELKKIENEKNFTIAEFNKSESVKNNHFKMINDIYNNHINKLINDKTIVRKLNEQHIIK